MNGKKYPNKTTDGRMERLRQLRQDLDKREAGGIVYFQADFEEHL